MRAILVLFNILLENDLSRKQRGNVLFSSVYQDEAIRLWLSKGYWQRKLRKGPDLTLIRLFYYFSSTFNHSVSFHRCCWQNIENTEDTTQWRFFRKRWSSKGKRSSTRLSSNLSVDLSLYWSINLSACALQQKHVMVERNVLLKGLQHPFLVGLHFSFQTANMLYFVLDYVNGGEVRLAKVLNEITSRMNLFFVCVSGLHPKVGIHVCDLASVMFSALLPPPEGGFLSWAQSCVLCSRDGSGTGLPALPQHCLQVPDPFKNQSWTPVNYNVCRIRAFFPPFIQM